MLVQQLAIAYKFHSCIGNSINLKEMMFEVLRTFVSESYAVYGEFCTKKNNSFKKIVSFGKLEKFDSKKYLENEGEIKVIEKDGLVILRINLEKGAILLVSTTTAEDSKFFYSMYESLIPKLNLSVNACLNYKELQESHELLIKRKRELVRANKTKDDFLANMSHELKTPLNSIIVISTLMSKNKSQNLDDKQLKNIKIMKKCADDLLDLINDILDISKIEAGELSIYKEKMSLSSLINELYDTFKLIAYDKNIEFHRKIIGENFDIDSDEKRLKQILKNLISNAIKFTNSGGVIIELFEEKNNFVINVIDSGIGIEKNYLKHVFDRFKQVDNSRTRKYGGTGLGLAISNELASMLDSSLEVTSEINVGSRFSLIIPKITSSNNKIKSERNHDDDFFMNLSQSADKEYDSFENNKNVNVLLKHSSELEQFKLTVNLKKEGYNVFPIIDFAKLDIFLQNLKNNEFIIILDKNSSEYNEILNRLVDYEKSLYLITNSDVENYKFDCCIKEKLQLEDLIECIKSWKLKD